MEVVGGKGSRNMSLNSRDGMLEDIFSSYGGFICVCFISEITGYSLDIQKRHSVL